MSEMIFTMWVFLGFAGMEFFSYAVHRFLFHGVFWRIHQTHHVARKGWFELNDVFSIVFGACSVCLIIFAEKPLLDSIAFPVGVGIALYGVFYFIVHDAFTHRRFLPFNSENPIFKVVRAAHQRHHQTAEKQGIEPFGLFVFDYGKFWKKTKIRRAPTQEAKIPN